MELILNKDVDNLGFTDDVVEVKNGYGRNYLIPHGYASLATPSAKKALAEKLKQRAYKDKKIIDAANKEAQRLNGLEINITAKAGNDGKLFGSVTNADVSTALEKEGIEIEKKFISIAGGAVKRTGQYEATIRFHRDVVETLTFEVVSES
ncbi:50S ribosomal protein L9 [Gangjinia marincola]|uniref:Large ribosomal subunit protein bL9 n=1 Tax=Gangjinia marincola TaxID=578463 RepID=A0ABN1MFT5_9FLAO